MHRDDPDQLAKARQGSRHADRVIRAPRGSERTAKSWLTEAALRMIQNNLDPEVAENPKELVVYGGIGRAARNWECFDAILAALRELDDDESLLIQSGKPVGVFKTHADAPRVLIANSNLVPRWATWEHFNELDRKGLMMYGQMTAGSWIYIGSQGIVQGTYETFAEAGRQHYGGKLADRWILTAGLGGMGGAQPLAATMAGASMLAVECQQSRIEMRLATRYLDRQAKDLDDALAIIRDACAAGRPVSVGLLGNAAEILPELVRRGVRPDMVTDQTSAHDLVYGYLPAGWTVERWRAAQADPAQHAALDARRRSNRSSLMSRPCSRSSARACRRSTTATTSGRSRWTKAWRTRSRFPVSFPPTSARSSAKARDRFAGSRCRAIRRTSTRPTARWRSSFRTTRICSAGSRWPGSGSRSRACPRASAGSGLGERHLAGLAFNEMVKTGELKAPIVIGRDHLDTGSVASPNRETEAMADGSDAVSDWPLLNLLLNTAAGATWVSFHHGGGVGMGYSQHAGVVIVCDGTDAAAKRIGRVLWNDPATGVMRHADAGYATAIERREGEGSSPPHAGTLARRTSPYANSPRGLHDYRTSLYGMTPSLRLLFVRRQHITHGGRT